jgi:hypothetical protein
MVRKNQFDTVFALFGGDKTQAACLVAGGLSFFTVSFFFR